MSAIIWVLVFFGVVWAGMAVFFITRFIKYKHDFILKRTQGNSFVAYRTKAREYKDDSGTEYWKLLKYKKELIPVPPKDSLAINKKGKFYVEGWLLDDGQIQYEKHPVPCGVDISTTNQKILLANQIEKAKSERYKSWKELLNQYVLQLGPMLILALVVIMGIIFWGDINSTGLEAKSVQTHQLELMNENLKLLKEIKLDVQFIDEVKASKSTENSPPE